MQYCTTSFSLTIVYIYTYSGRIGAHTKASYKYETECKTDAVSIEALVVGCRRKPSHYCAVHVQANCHTRHSKHRRCYAQAARRARRRRRDVDEEDVGLAQDVQQDEEVHLFEPGQLPRLAYLRARAAGP